ncbi:2-phosphoxylose phosphatase 1 [Lampetra fluviatilis]
MMTFQNRFVLLLGLAALLAVISLSLQFFRLIPLPVGFYGEEEAKPRKRVLIDGLLKAPQALDPITESVYYCNRPNGSVQGLEGHAPVGFKLEAAHIMIRHGDRYPLYAIPNAAALNIDCNIRTDRAPFHRALEGFVAHMAQAREGRFDGPLAGFPLLPSHPRCEMGQLTQTGVVQHLMIGQHLRQTYSDLHGLLLKHESEAERVRAAYVESTGRARTLQSALALLYGLRPAFDWSRLRVHHQPSASYCYAACECPARSAFQELDQRRQSRARSRDPQLARAFRDMASALDVPPARLRAAVPVDPLLAHFCHGVPFPCASSLSSPPPLPPQRSGCVSEQHFRTLRAQQLVDEKERKEAGLFRRFALLVMHPFLNRTAQRLGAVAAGKPAERLALYSAHDVTLEPALSALGLTGARFPRYAARLVFELWRKEDKGRLAGGADVGGHFIRVLYNGEDVTFKTAFCQNHDWKRGTGSLLCPFQKFLDFVSRDMFAPFNSTSYYEACHHIPQPDADM